jgi:hypothetical protein
MALGAQPMDVLRAGSHTATRRSPWWLSANIAKTRFGVKNVGSPWEIFSLVPGIDMQRRRTRASCLLRSSFGVGPPFDRGVSSTIWVFSRFRPTVFFFAVDFGFNSSVLDRVFDRSYASRSQSVIAPPPRPYG